MRSIIGRLLEHSRIFYFAAGTNPAEGAFFIGSADWMSRNLSSRVEVVTPVLARTARAALGGPRRVSRGPAPRVAHGRRRPLHAAAPAGNHRGASEPRHAPGAHRFDDTSGLLTAETDNRLFAFCNPMMSVVFPIPADRDPRSGMPTGYLHEAQRREWPRAICSVVLSLLHPAHRDGDSDATVTVPRQQSSVQPQRRFEIRRARTDKAPRGSPPG